MPREYRTNYTRGYVVEYLADHEEHCTSWILLPAENLWSEGVRGALYIMALVYIFIGVAIASDAFMSSIEVITSKKRKVVRWDEERQEKVEREVLLWNETVANLTLMALGSSAPEILLATGEMVGDLNLRTPKDALGTFTIIGSAAFNLLVITAVCVLSVPTGEVKSIKEVGVFIVTSIWSIWAYVWMLLVVKFITPGQIDLWEAWVTLAYLPLFVFMAYLTDRGWCCSKKVEGLPADDDDSHVPVRVVGAQHQHGFAHTVPKELRVLEAEKAHRMSVEQPRVSERRRRETMVEHRARFRHSVTGSLMGSYNVCHRFVDKSERVADVLAKVSIVNDAISHGRSADDGLGKFYFTADHFTVLASAGVVDIDVIFQRHFPFGPVRKSVIERSHSEQLNMSVNGVAGPNVVSVTYETRDGTAKPKVDFTYTQGTLTFEEDEYRKTLFVPIQVDTPTETNVDFYIILKNPTGAATLGDPSIARVTIVNDEQPGEFLFDEAHYYVDMKSGKATVKVVREHGFDGHVTLDYSTINGTAVGGTELGPSVDYIESNGRVHFEHGETSKIISVDINRDAKGAKNFIIALRNASVGAKVGIRSAVVVHLNKDQLLERVGEVLADDDEEELSWGGQFIMAMTLTPDKDEQGNELPLRWIHYLMHYITFFWKVTCAVIPPRSCLGAWPAFFTSLVLIGTMTSVVEEIGTLLGCVVGLETSVAGITIIALGTSLPDTFASRTAAVQDEHADAAIGNITGSNSVNVFLGLGLPWVLKTMHAMIYGYTFKVKTDNLSQGVLIFGSLGTLCIIALLIRRKVQGGELGGKTRSGKVLFAAFIVSLWLLYIVLCSLKAYGRISL